MINQINNTEQSLLAKLAQDPLSVDGQITPSQDFMSNQVSGHSFEDFLADKISEVNAAQNMASAQIKAVELGRSDDLVGAMVASQKASLSFSAMVQIRNKLVQALDDIMKMPV